jgi:hypothetical protein
MERKREGENTSASQILIKLLQDYFSGETLTSCSLAGNLKLSRSSIYCWLMSRQGKDAPSTLSGISIQPCLSAAEVKEQSRSKWAVMTTLNPKILAEKSRSSKREWVLSYPDLGRDPHWDV